MRIQRAQLGWRVRIQRAQLGWRRGENTESSTRNLHLLVGGGVREELMCHIPFQ